MKHYLEYNNENLDGYCNFIDLLSQHVSLYLSSDSPYINGEWDKNYTQFLGTATLSDHGMNPDELSAEMADYFKGLVRWHYPYTFYNVKSPVNIYAAATSALAMLYDGNLANDRTCGKMASAELEVIKYLSEIAGYDTTSSTGYFTFGGTATLLNAIKLGITKADIGSTEAGLSGKYFVICSEQEHHSIVKCCDWLGIGKRNCIMIKTQSDSTLDIKQAESIIDYKIIHGQKLAAIILCGGSTVQGIIDSIDEVHQMRERIVKKHKLKYFPHLHVDAVIGWPILFFRDYPFETNPQHFRADAVKLLQRSYLKLESIYLADSFGADFHKTGFCPFISSVFIVKDKKDLLKISTNTYTNSQCVHYGEYNPCNYSLETSRPLSGAIAALTVLKTLGKNGMRAELTKMSVANLMIRTLLCEFPDFEIINPPALGINIIFIVKPIAYKYNYDDLAVLSHTNAYRLAKYIYNFYLYSLCNIGKYHVFFNYISPPNRNVVNNYIGVLQMQSFSPLLSEVDVQNLVETLRKIKDDYDKTQLPPNAEFPFLPSKIKYGFKHPTTHE